MRALPDLAFRAELTISALVSCRCWQDCALQLPRRPAPEAIVQGGSAQLLEERMPHRCGRALGQQGLARLSGQGLV